MTQQDDDSWAEQIPDHFLAMVLCDDCAFCSQVVEMIWTASEVGLHVMDATPVPGGVHRDGAWKRIQLKLRERGHSLTLHRADAAAGVRPLIRFMLDAMHDEVDPERVPTPPEVPSSFTSAFRED